MGDHKHYHPNVKAPKMGERLRPDRTETFHRAHGLNVGGAFDRSGWRHAFMLGTALVFLTAIGLILPHGDSGDLFRNWLLGHPLFWPFMAILWGIVIAEGLFGLFLATDAWPERLKRFLMTALLPPSRMVIASSTPSDGIWIPRVGWKPVGKATLAQLEQRAALPMAVVTLLVLPVLSVELAYGEKLDRYPHLALITHLITSAIWLGFTVEFFWMVTAAPKRLTYCLQHWINLVIILVPLVAFLRVLRMLRLSRMVRAGRLLRAYRLRGLSSRMWRLIMLFNLFERLQQRDPVKYCAALEAKIDELEEEMAGLRAKLAQARKRISTPAKPLAPPPSTTVKPAQRELVEK